MTYVPRLEDAINTLGLAITTAINAAGITYKAQGVPGMPVSTELSNILGQADDEYLYTIFPTDAGKDATRYSPAETTVKTPPIVTLTASVSGKTITFAGSVPTTGPQYNVHIFVGSPLADAFFTTSSADSPSTVATKAAASVNALALPGVTESVIGPACTVNGTPTLKCNIGGVGSISQEVGRYGRLLQVSIYAPNPTVRSVVGDAIITAVGTSKAHFYPLSDGSALYCRKQNDRWIEKAQSSYSAFEWHIIFAIEYGQLQTDTGYQVEAVEIVTTINQNAPVTVISGG
jgi:hypothetical protein